MYTYCLYLYNKQINNTIMIHLEKQTTKQIASISLNRLACVNNPFIKGAIRKIEEFGKDVKAGKQVCKKCLSIYQKLAY